MKPEPIFLAVESVAEPTTDVILLSPTGRVFSQSIAAELAGRDHLVLICGHYEGVDERVREHLATDEISIGDYVLTGGELAAMVVIDAVARLLPASWVTPSRPATSRTATGCWSTRTTPARRSFAAGRSPNGCSQGTTPRSRSGVGASRWSGRLPCAQT